MADVHLGAHREPALQKLEMRAFEEALTKAVELRADFILVCGDLFHVGIPDLGVVNSALHAMMQVRKKGVGIYAIYGSHDYTPNGTSIIDLLNTAGVLTNLSRWRIDGGKLELDVLTDEKTGAKLTGISARRIGLESKYYEILDREALESVKGFKIFAFHSGLTELKPEHLSEMDTVSVSLFPRGFDYYAGGHIHQRGAYSLEGFGRVGYPGPLFTGYGKDIEETAKGEPRGFYLVEFEEKVRNTEFVPLGTFQGVYRAYDLSGRNSLEATEWISDDVQGADVDGKVVVMRASGELAGGKVSEVDFARIKRGLSERGALHVYLNRNALKSREAAHLPPSGEDPSTIEKRLLTSEVGKVSVSDAGLRGEKGAAAGMELLRALRQQAKLGEAKKDYVLRMVKDGRRILGSEKGTKTG